MVNKKKYFILFILILLINNSFSQTINWQPLNEPGSGGAITDIAISPYNSNKVLLAGDVLNASYSLDGGVSWLPTFGFKSNEIAAFTYHPTDSNIIWVGTMSGPYKSIDGGVNWLEKRIGMNPILEFSYSCPIQKILFDPLDVNHLLAFGGNMRNWLSPGAPEWNAVWSSTDGGESWSKTSTIGTITGPGIMNAEYAGNNKIVVAARYQGVFISTDNGVSWSLSNTGLPTTDVLYITVDKNNANVMYVGLNNYLSGGVYQPGGIYKTTDGGNSWVNFSNGLEQTSHSNKNQASYYRSVKIAPTNSNVLYTSNSGWNNSGVYKSLDAGATWVAVLNKNTTNNFPEVAYPQSAPELYAFSIDPTDENVMIGGNWEYVLKTVNGGSTWEDIMSEPVPSAGVNYFKGNGFSGLVAENIEFNPFDSSHSVIQGWDDAKFMQSNDNLQSWQLGGAGNTGMWRHQGGTDVTFGDTDGNTMYCTTGQYGFDGVWKTIDRGNNWTHFSISDFPGASSTKRPLGIHTLPTNTNKAWVVLDNKLYYTTNGGTSWAQVFSALGLNVISEVSDTPNTFYLNSNAGVYKTTDGITFNLMPSSPTKGRKIVCDPNDNNILYVTKWRTDDGNEGLWKYDGTTWSLLKNDYYLYDLAIQPGNSQAIIITTTDHPYHDVMRNSGVWLSIDGGQNWTKQNTGLPMQRVNSIAFNPYEPNQVIIGTGGRGFFKGILILTDLIADEDTQHILLYPNPTKDVITLDLGELRRVKITINDVLGKTMYINKNTGQTMQISMKGFATGVYFLNIQKIDNEQVSLFKIIKID
ncbi:MAG: T9SS type A sorting domain-containing protein [Flavobacteriaceae bacterium]|nr:T9SS type A sorting domain-containing protein [Flavobacteriaceae bacterium]